MLPNFCFNDLIQVAKDSFNIFVNWVAALKMSVDKIHKMILLTIISQRDVEFGMQYVGPYCQVHENQK